MVFETEQLRTKHTVNLDALQHPMSLVSPSASVGSPAGWPPAAEPLCFGKHPSVTQQRQLQTCHCTKKTGVATAIRSACMLPTPASIESADITWLHYAHATASSRATGCHRERRMLTCKPASCAKHTSEHCSSHQLTTSCYNTSRLHPRYDKMRRPQPRRQAIPDCGGHICCETTVHK